MFGNKTYKKAKKKVFESDKKRKQYFAVQGYYKKKAMLHWAKEKQRKQNNERDE